MTVSHVPPPPPVIEISRGRPWIIEAAARFQLPPAWITAVMRAESGGRLALQGRPITSPAGAMGLMQIMPTTWAELRRRYRLGPDPYAPHDNILAGAAYLRELYVRYGYPDLFAAYNAGPGRLQANRERGAPLPQETKSYLAKLTGLHRAPGLGGAPPQPPLFFPLHTASEADH
jgi:soluble lytic murein transglycosylase-like protein